MSYSYTTQERRVLGLCYDEKFYPDHKCSTSRFVLLLDNIDCNQYFKEKTLELSTTDVIIHFHLYSQTLACNLSPRTLKFIGIIQNLSITILIDLGRSHNILQPHVAYQLHLPISPSSHFTVMVENGAFIICLGICPSVEISLQNSIFTIPLYLLPIEWSDVVLQVDWLRTLCPITTVLSILSIAFTHINQHITLKATTTLTQPMLPTITFANSLPPTLIWVELEERHIILIVHLI